MQISGLGFLGKVKLKLTACICLFRPGNLCCVSRGHDIPIAFSLAGFGCGDDVNYMPKRLSVRTRFIRCPNMSISLESLFCVRSSG